MLRLAGVMVVVLLMGAGLERAEGSPSEQQNILVAGQTQIATIDMNQNGMLNEEDDCVFTGQATPGGGSLNVTGSQAPGPNQARGCTGSCYGTGFTSASQIGVLLDDCEFAGGPFVPLQGDFCTTMAACASSGTATLAQPSGASPDPVILTFGTLFRTLTQDQAGSGQLCSANGPAIEIIDEDGLRVLRELFPYPEGSPTHMCASNVPVQLENDGFVNRTACFPSNGGVSPIALSGAPDDPFAIINLNALPPCGGESRGAPTVSQLGLAILLLALLGFGVRTLSRRRGFAEVLPLL